MSVIDIIIIIGCFAFLIYVFTNRKIKTNKKKFISCQGCMTCLNNVRKNKTDSANKNSLENNQDC